MPTYLLQLTKSPRYTGWWVGYSENTHEPRFNFPIIPERPGASPYALYREKEDAHRFLEGNTECVIKDLVKRLRAEFGGKAEVEIEPVDKSMN